MRRIKELRLTEAMKRALCIVGVAGAIACGGAVAEAQQAPTVEGPIPVNSKLGYPFDAASHQQTPIDLARYGYVEEEYFLHGAANVYQYANLSDPSAASVKVIGRGPYTNRILVHRPADPSRFSGNVIIEIMNATPHYDIPIMWSYDQDYFISHGDIWIGVTSKPVDVVALKKFNPARYASLSWANPNPNENAQNCPLLPSDSSYSTENGLLFDIFAQVGVLLRSPSTPLKGFDVRAIYGVGYSQSAFNLMAYINAIAPLSLRPVFDGYLVSSAFGTQSALNQCIGAPPSGDPRNILHSPTAAIVQTQTLSDYISGRADLRPDGNARMDRYRLYEIAGSAHIVVDQLRSLPDATDTAAAGGQTMEQVFATCSPGGPLSTYPEHDALDDAWDKLEGWVRFGTQPAPSVLISTTGTYPSLTTVVELRGKHRRRCSHAHDRRADREIYGQHSRPGSMFYLRIHGALQSAATGAVVPNAGALQRRGRR